MRSFGRWIGNGGPAHSGLLVCAASAIWLGAASAAHSGPCTVQIAQLERQISLRASNPATGPTATQSVGAQLHHQPTPGTVEHAETVANADADAALQHARDADAAGNANGCNAALKEARRLYGIY
ncbi:MAG: hypothetical protein ABSE22_03150 [Xanthobacteraceae bacterium]|jgi:hypothetical protein